jgi:hypothetical protein
MGGAVRGALGFACAGHRSFVQGQLEVAGAGAAGHIDSAGGPTAVIALGGTATIAEEQSDGYLRFLSMNRFDHYRPKFDVALVVVLVAVVSVAGLFIIEVENPRLSHFPQPPSAETRAAAAEAGARVTPSDPAEARPVEMRRPAIVDKRDAE